MGEPAAAGGIRRGLALWQKVQHLMLSEQCRAHLQRRRQAPPLLRKTVRESKEILTFAWKTASDPLSLDHLCLTACTLPAPSKEFLEFAAPVLGQTMLQHQYAIVTHLDEKVRLARNEAFQKDRKQINKLDPTDPI